MQKLKRFILDKKNLSGFVILLFLYNTLIFRLFSNGVYYHIGYEFFLSVSFLWTLLLFIDDVINFRIIDTKIKLLFWILYVFTMIVFLFNRPYNLLSIISILYFFLMWYILMSSSLYSTKKEFHKFFICVSKQIVIVVLIINAISVLGYILYVTGIVHQLPDLFALESNHHVGRGILGRFFTLPFLYAGLYYYSGNAGFYSYIAYILGFFLYENKTIHRETMIVSSLLSLFMIIVSDNRVSVICGIVTTVLFLIRSISLHLKSKRKAKYVMRFIYSLLFVCIIVFIIKFFPSAYEQIKTSPFDYLNYLSSQRLIYWRDAIYDFLQRKWIGYGWGNNGTMPYYRIHFHNLFICILVWTGIIGSLISLYIIINITIRIIKNRELLISNKSYWILVMVVCVFFESMLDICIVGETTHIETPLFWVGIGYLYYFHINTPLIKGFVWVNKTNHFADWIRFPIE